MKLAKKMKASKISTSMGFFLLLCCSFILFSACTVKQIDPMSFKVQKEDLQQAEHPPTHDELSIQQNILLPIIVYQDPTVTETRGKEILSFIHGMLEKQGNFSIIPSFQIDQMLEKDENRGIQLSNVSAMIQLGQQQNATHISQLQITIQKSSVVKNIDHYEANIKLTVFTTNSREHVFSKDILFNTQNKKDSKSALKELVQTYFPLKGYILETRGNHQVAKISLGRSLGIEIGRKLDVRERLKQTEIVNGESRTTVSFSPNAIATVKVIRIMENDCWVTIDKDDQKKIKKGQVIFTTPETSNPFL